MGVALKIQQFLDENSCLDPSQSSFQPGCGTETALADNLKWDLDRGVHLSWSWRSQ